MDTLRTIIVDDSTSYRKILERTLAKIESVEVVGTACDGVEGLQAIEAKRPDLVLLDVVMPNMDGLEALEEISKRFPDVSVLMVSGASDARRTVKALGLGAIDFIVKPESNGASSLRDQVWKGVCVVQAQRRAATRGGVAAEKSPQRVPASPRPKRVGSAVSTPKTQPAPTSVVSAAKPQKSHRAAPSPHAIARAAAGSQLIVIGISTGGPRALEQLVPQLPASLPCPVLIVQHMPKGFTESLAHSLDAASPLEVREAKDGDEVAVGRVLIAPGGRQMEVKRKAGGLVIHIHDGPPVNECRPAVDVLMDSVGEHYRGDVLTGILTGMGHDGNEGVARLKEKGAYCIVQDEKTCVVYGMPRTVVEAGNADEVLPLDRIAPRMLAWATGVEGGSGS